ncbi:DEAD-domain-containing protein, partial [Athelia psychrophila]
MSPVQAEVLPLLPQIAEPYSGALGADGKALPRDVLVKARTGTGKTLAFLVPAVEARLKAIEAHGLQAVKDAGLTTDKALKHRAERIYAREAVGTLIISPTRELATQIANEALRLTHHHAGFEVRLFVGGSSKRMQMRDWMKGRRDIVVATPGRLRDLLTSEPEIVRGLSKTGVFVLDEADTLLDMGFRDDIDAIAEYLPKTPQRQTFLFSATVSRNIQQIARATLDKNHVFINTVSAADSPVHAHVPQFHTVLPSAAEQLPHALRLLAHDQLTHP